MLRSYLCDCSDAYILVKGRRNATGTNDANRRNKKLTFKNNAPFTLFITKVSSIFIENAGDFDKSCRCLICQGVVIIVL